MINYLIGFKCIGCGKLFPSSYENYICDECFENIDALYDYKEISKVFSVQYLKANPQRDIWRYKPLFPFEDIKYIPPVDMSLTPLYRSSKLQKDTGLSEVYLKDDTRLPTASFKDRASSVVMAVAREKKVRVAAAASTGNAGCSWACMGAVGGIKVIIYVPESAPKAKIAQLKVYGADIRMVHGTYDNAYDLCVSDSHTEGYFNRCTGYNPYTREGKKSVSFEIWEQLGYNAPGAVFVPVGDGNIISGVWKGFRDLKELNLIDKLPELIAVQSENSDAVARTIEKIPPLTSILSPSPCPLPLGERIKERGRGQGEGETDKVSEKIELETVKAATIADSISVDKPKDGLAAIRAVIETQGKAVRVSDKEIIENIFYIASSSGVFTEPAGATSVAGLRKLALQGKIREPVVCLLTGNGLKDVEAVLKENVKIKNQNAK